MRHRDLLIILLCLLLCIGSIGLGSLTLKPINANRQALDLTINEDVLKNLPPSYALLTILGGPFRTLAIQVLWYRSRELQQQGMYHDAQNEARMIARLQARFPRVWDFLAWNMIYNISVATQTPQERWLWISAGIDLMRNEGIPANPTSVKLFRELSWYFHHKVAQHTDRFNRYYKLMMAMQWQCILGQMPIDEPEAMMAKFQAIAHWQQGDAVVPEQVTLAGVLGRLIEKRPSVAGQLDALAIAGYDLRSNDWETAESFLRLVAFAQQRNAQPQLQEMFPPSSQAAERYEAYQQWSSDPATQADRDALIDAVRAAVLMGRYHMSPKLMYQIMEKLGVIDWRHPSAHALYWATAGVRVGKTRPLTEALDFQMINTRRVIASSIQDLWRMGRVEMDLVSNFALEDQQPRNDAAEVVYQPDLRLTDATLNMFNDQSETQDYFGLGTAEVSKDSFRDWRMNFLIEVVQLVYLYGSKEKAGLYYRILREEYFADHPDMQQSLELPLEQFVALTCFKDMDTYTKAAGVVDGMLYQGIVAGLLNNDRARFERMYDMAGRVHNAYNAMLTNQTTLARAMVLPPFRLMVYGAFRRFLLSGGNRVSPYMKFKVWHQIPLPLQWALYDTVRPTLEAECKALGWEMATSFPEPEGMKAYREKVKARIEAEKKKRSEENNSSAVDRN